jgi:hypothetical protein
MMRGVQSVTKHCAEGACAAWHRLDFPPKTGGSCPPPPGLAACSGSAAKTWQDFSIRARLILPWLAEDLVTT